MPLLVLIIKKLELYMKNITITSIIFFLLININYTFSQTNNNTIENSLEYANQRNDAISLVKKEKWQESIEILKNLTEQYQSDTDLFYLLGLSYYETGQFKNAIIVLKKTLESGGTILRNIPTGSAPSNDIMIKIAKAYAEDGDKELF